MREKTLSAMAKARKAAGLNQREAAEAWTTKWPDEPKTAKTLTYWEAWPGPTGRQPSLDALQRLAELYDCRIGDLVDGDGPVVLEVAVVVVVHDDAVLLVQRADDLGWQFPAGTVKPERTPERVAVREVLAETGVHCSVRGQLGHRVHPKTRALCRYFAADYLAGDAVNGDHDENAAVCWAPIVRLSEFIPDGSIYPPVLDHLGAARV